MSNRRRRQARRRQRRHRRRRRWWGMGSCTVRVGMAHLDTALCQNGPIRPEGAVWARNCHFGQNVPNGPIGPEWSGLIRVDRFGQNGPFGPDWPDRARMGRLEQNGPFRPGLVQTWPRTGPILGPKPAPIIREYGSPYECLY